MKKHITKKVIAKWFAIPLVLIVSYLAALQYWSWKWDTPKHPLPEAHLSYQDISQNTSSLPHWRESAQTNLVNLADKLRSVSISGAINVDGDLAWAGTVGLASVEPLNPANVSTQYRIGSVSKPLTIVVLMRMVEEGLIDLDAPIQDYLPDYPKYSQPITIRQLASHTSGVRHYQFEPLKFPPTDSLSNIAFESTNDALQQFKDDDLLFVPGQNFAYSTHGYTLLSAVIEAAGGRTFESLLQQLVTEPLGLVSTQAEHLLTSKNSLAKFYVSDKGLYGRTPEQNLSNKVAGGGLVSTPTELVKLGSALLSNTLLTKQSFMEMTTVQKMPDGQNNPQYYSLGWRHHKTKQILENEQEVDVIHHGGVSVGSNAFMLLVPEHNISVAIMTNGKGQTSRREIQLLAYQFAGMVINDKREREDTEPQMDTMPVGVGSER
ncbi:serine hydrolase domain-containing protein [Pseudoalteromonas sp.]|uniref:serine hydrolase domain-containing protein n=1 Tax=Pseudoalteromonas sp. TaxID=53249 RepID=UPI00356626E0